MKWNTKSLEKKHESFGRPPCNNYSVLSSRGSRIIIMEIKSSIYIRTRVSYTFCFLIHRSCVVVYTASDNRSHFYPRFFFFFILFICQQSWISFSDETRDCCCSYTHIIPRWWFLSPYVSVRSLAFFFFVYVVLTN